MSSFSVWQIVLDTSPFGLFILIVLVVMSFVSWTIIFNKWRVFRGVDQAIDHFLSHFGKIRRLADALGQSKSYGLAPMAAMYREGYEELGRIKELKNEAGGLTQTVTPLTNDDFEIVEMTMEKTMSDELGVLQRRIIFLATTASAAPFLGLLGTVVGIMDSFWSIGERGSASLAIVAPGIAEALLATIVGLGAAIPAVIAYNWANNKMRSITEKSNSFILSFLAQAKRESF